MIDQTILARQVAAGLRNLIAHRYGALDWVRIHDVASNRIEDLLRFCDVLTHAATHGMDKS